MSSTPQNPVAAQPTVPGKRKRVEEPQPTKPTPPDEGMEEGQIPEPPTAPTNSQNPPTPPLDHVMEPPTAPATNQPSPTPSLDHIMDIEEPDVAPAEPFQTLPEPDEQSPIEANPHLQTNRRGDEPINPQASSMPFTSATFPRTVIPYYAILGNIHDETIAAIENNPDAFLAIIPYGGGKRLMEENTALGKDIETFIRSLGYQNSERIRVTAPKAKYPPVNDFGKPHTLLLTNPPRDLVAFLTYQQTFAFETSKEEGQKKIAFHALPFDKTIQSWIITDISGSYVSEDDYARMSALATIKNTLSRDRNYRNIVDRSYAARASPLDLDGRVEDSLKSFHLNTVKLQQIGKEDSVVWQVMARPISSNHNNYEEWINAIRSTSYLVDHVFPLETHRVVYRCDFCKNETHPYNMCPFPKTEGWKGPIPEDVLRTRENNNARRQYNNPQKNMRGTRSSRGSRGSRGRGPSTQNSPRGINRRS